MSNDTRLETPRPHSFRADTTRIAKQKAVSTARDKAAYAVPDTTHAMDAWAMAHKRSGHRGPGKVTGEIVRNTR